MMEMEQMLRKRKLDEDLAMMAAMKQPRMDLQVGTMGNIQSSVIALC